MKLTSAGRFGRCLCLSVYAHGYRESDDQPRSDFQRALLRVLDHAAEAAGLERWRWRRQIEGAEELSLLPMDEQEQRILVDLVRELDVALERYNHEPESIGRLRLRIALHYGVAFPDRKGFGGQGPIEVSRLRDSCPARTALAAAEQANLILIISDGLFQDVTGQKYTSVRAADFREVHVEEQGLITKAWIRMPGVDVHGVDLSEAGCTSG